MKYSTKDQQRLFALYEDYQDNAEDEYLKQCMQNGFEYAEISIDNDPTIFSSFEESNLFWEKNRPHGARFTQVHHPE